MLWHQGFNSSRVGLISLSSKSKKMPILRLLLLSHYKVSGPPGQEQRTKDHCVAEENKFEQFFECPEEAHKQGLHIQGLDVVILIHSTTQTTVRFYNNKK
ncbi:hypothetical protein AMECASPLE_030136 [Ameca splendens]|uniref:Uncharacterized protein n=1 Tax=Ameca splendens TaxID=208324 RepID=A0ABV0XIX5_9TELE